MSSLAKLVVVRDGRKLKVSGWKRAARGRSAVAGQITIDADNLRSTLRDPEVLASLGLPTIELESMAQSADSNKAV